MTYMKKDVNGILLFLVLMTCVALVGLTVVFANQFDGFGSDYNQLKADLEVTSKELTAKEQKLQGMQELLDKHIEREKKLEELLKKQLKSWNFLQFFAKQKIKEEKNMTINNFFDNTRLNGAYERKEELLRRVLIGDQSAFQAYSLACDEYQALLDQSTLSKLGLKMEVK